jgi:hypothetical protein
MRFIVILLLAAPTFWAHAENNAPEERAALNLSSCFHADKKFGYFPIPGCTVKVKARVGSGPKLFEFNKLGLRDHDYSPDPGKTVRILLLGPSFDGTGLSEQESASHKLEERLRSSGLKDVEVINGSVASFYGPRTAELAVQLIKEYKPDLVVYYETGDALSQDFFEARGMDQGKFEHVPESSRFLYAYTHFKAYWSNHRSAKSNEEEAEKFIQPTLTAFEKIRGALGPNQRMVVFYTSNFVQDGYATTAWAQPWSSIFARLLPTLNLPTDWVTRELGAQGFHVYPLARGFRTAVLNDLAFASEPISLTPEGAHAFAWSSALWIKPEINSLPKAKNVKMTMDRKVRRDRKKKF